MIGDLRVTFHVSGEVEIDTSGAESVDPAWRTTYEYSGGRWRQPQGWLTSSEVSARLGFGPMALDALVAGFRSGTRIGAAIERRSMDLELSQAEERASDRILRELTEAQEAAYYAGRAISARARAMNRFDAEESPRTPPPEIAGVEGLAQLGAIRLGYVYFLVREGRVVYVGQTRVGWPARIEQHAADPNKDFDDVWFIRCPMESLDEVEGRYIREIRPEYNRMGIPT